MAYQDIQPGFMGFATSIAGGGSVCSSFDIRPEQTPLFYTHIMGLRDEFSEGSKGPGDGPNLGRTLWRPSVRLLGGSVSCSPTDNDNLQGLFDATASGATTSLSLRFGCGAELTVPNAVVESLDISCTAGGILGVNANFVGTGDLGGSKSFTDSIKTFHDSEPKNGEVLITGDEGISWSWPIKARSAGQLGKLITWDTVVVTATGATAVDFANVSFRISNKVIPIVFADGENMSPFELRLGIQEVSGEVTFYGDGNMSWIDDLSEDGHFSISTPIGGISTPAIFLPANPQGTPNPITTSTIAFVGVDKIDI